LNIVGIGAQDSVADAIESDEDVVDPSRGTFFNQDDTDLY
jgi:hypothetical protein